jgi:hypothetical protein
LLEYIGEHHPDLELRDTAGASGTGFDESDTNIRASCIRKVTRNDR